MRPNNTRQLRASVPSPRHRRHRHGGAAGYHHGVAVGRSISIGRARGLEQEPDAPRKIAGSVDDFAAHDGEIAARVGDLIRCAGEIIPIEPQDTLQQPLLHLLDTVVGINVGVVCKWAASSLLDKILAGKA
jgi:hypothetical protein